VAAESRRRFGFRVLLAGWSGFSKMVCHYRLNELILENILFYDPSPSSRGCGSIASGACFLRYLQ
jgi:hypothetical protein